MQKIRKNQKGFETLTVIGLTLVLLIVSAVGWYVWKNRDTASDSSNSFVATQREKEKDDEPSETYLFKELNISISLESGWSVKESKNVDNSISADNLQWDIQKDGSDARIQVSSKSFRGGFPGCSEEPLTKVVVEDVEDTKNDSLRYVKYTYSYAAEKNTVVGIIRSDKPSFRETNNYNTTPLKGNELKSGDYFLCISDPDPVFNIDMNTSDEDKIDSVRAYSSKSDAAIFDDSDKSFKDIKKMLISIK